MIKKGKANMTDKEILSILFPDGTSIGQMEEYEETLEMLSTPKGRGEAEAFAMLEQACNAFDKIGAHVKYEIRMKDGGCLIQE